MLSFHVFKNDSLLPFLIKLLLVNTINIGDKE